jgi:hypothetical protein
MQIKINKIKVISILLSCRLYQTILKKKYLVILKFKMMILKEINLVKIDMEYRVIMDTIILLASKNKMKI